MRWPLGFEHARPMIDAAAEIRTIGRPLDSMGVAARTLLYPLLAMGGGLHVRRKPSAGANKRQIVILDPSATQGAKEVLRQARECVADAERTIFVCWSLAKADAAALALDLLGHNVRFGVPPSWGSDPRFTDCGFVVPLSPATAGLDMMVRAAGMLTPAACEPALDRRSDDRPAIACFVGGLEVLPALRSRLERLRAADRMRVLLIAPNPGAARAVVSSFPVPVDLFDEADPAWLLQLGGVRAVVLAGGGRRSLASSVWSLTAARVGAPVIADDDVMIEEVGAVAASGGWERALSLYLRDSWFRCVDTAVAQQQALQLDLSSSAEVWRKVLQADPAAVGVRRGPTTPPVLMTFIDLPQDLDLALPVLLQLRERGDVALRVIVTDWLQREAPRTFLLLEEAGFRPEIVKRGKAISGAAPRFESVDGFFAPSATSEGPHRAGFRLTRLAKLAGAKTFTCQHGFENVGLTYRDHPPRPVRFASDVVFTWGPKAQLPAWVAASTLERVIAVGSPKPVRSSEETDQSSRLARLGPAQSLVGVFENLHWQRYDEDYVQRFLNCLIQASDALERFTFVVKPHSAGRWLAKNHHRLPARPNILIIDPLDPEWSRFTAPDLIAQVASVITTPSTVAVDAARAGKAVGVVGDPGAALTLYGPLPLLRSPDDWVELIRSAQDEQAYVERNELFVRRHFLTGPGDRRMARIIAEMINQGTRRGMADSAKKVEASA